MIETGSEFSTAFAKLSCDEQRIHLSLAKYQGWCILSAVQLASVHQLGQASLSVQAAARTIKRLESLIIAGYPELSLAAKKGWAREELSGCELQRVLTAMEVCGSEIVMLNIKKIEAWFLVGAIQLASRHSAFSKSPVGEIAVTIANQLQPLIAVEGILALFLKTGWDTRFDQV